MNFLYTTAMPVPPPPPQITGGRGTILSQEARLHALQIAEEIQAERGSYRKWNEVAKAVNRQYGSNVDGDLVKRQVTSMLRSVQRSGLNSVKRPRKHAEVIQQLLDPVSNKRQSIGPDGTPLRIRGPGEEGEDGLEEGAEGRTDVINVEVTESDRGSNTGSESGSPPGSPRTAAAAAAAASASTTTTAGEVPTITSFETPEGTTTTTTTSSPTLVSSSSPLPTPELTATPTKASTSITPTGTPETDKPATKSSSEAKKKTSASIKAHQLKFKQQQVPLMSHSGSLIPLQQQQIAHFAPAPVRILPNMPVDEVYNLVTRLHPDIDAEFIRTQEIDGGAFQTLTHKELTEFGVTTFGKRNKLLQLCISFDQQPTAVVAAPPSNQEFFYGRIPASFPNGAGFIETKNEPGNGEKHDGKESSEKKPPVTKVLDLEVVGVRKRYLIERENGAVEVLTPCKLRKYKNLTAAFEHLHPDKLAPIPSFSAPFSHVPAGADEKATTADGTTPATPPSPRTAAKLKAAGKSPAAKSATFIPPSAYFPVAYYPPTYITNPAGTAHPQGNLQWVSSPYPGVSPQRTPEKYHSFHPYTPPQTK